MTRAPHQQRLPARPGHQQPRAGLVALARLLARDLARAHERQERQGRLIEDDVCAYPDAAAEDKRP